MAWSSLDVMKRPAALDDQHAVVPALRGALLPLNDEMYIHSNTPRKQCSMCDLGADEDVLHFFGICPVLEELRAAALGQKTLTMEWLAMVLNDEKWWVDVAWLEAGRGLSGRQCSQNGTGRTIIISRYYG